MQWEWADKHENFCADDKLIVARARKIQKFMSQPFTVAEIFTGIKGAFVPLVSFDFLELVFCFIRKAVRPVPCWHVMWSSVI